MIILRKSGEDILYGADGNDILIGDDSDGKNGNYGDDIIKGGPGDDKLSKVNPLKIL